MKKLLRKDLGLVFCVHNVIFYILALLCIAMRFGREGDVMFMMVLLLAGLTVPGLIAHEQSQGRKPEQCSAETDRTTYVKEKYVLLVIMEAVGICAGALIWFICDRPAVLSDICISAVFTVPVAVAAVSLMIPLDLRFGSRNMLPLKLIFVGILASFFAGAFMNFWYWIDPYLGSRIGYYWSMIPEWLLMLVFILGAAAAAVISCAVSIKIVTKRASLPMADITPGSLSRNIKLFRLSNDMTQDQLAEKMFVTRQTVSNWENGKAQPDLDTLIKLSDVFDTDVDFLLNTGKKKEPLPNRNIYVLMSMALFILIHAALRLKDLLSVGWWTLFGGDIIYYSSAVRLIVPFLLNPLIMIPAGAMTASILSVFMDLRAGKRRSLFGILSTVLPFPSLMIAFRMLIMYNNAPVIDDYIKLPVRIILTVVLPFISGILLFLVLNEKRGRDLRCFKTTKDSQIQSGRRPPIS